MLTLASILILQVGCDNKSNPVKSKTDTTQNTTDTTSKDSTKEFQLYYFTPNQGEPLSEITIVGKNFDSSLKNIKVLFGDKTAILKSVNSNDSSYLNVYVPYDAKTDFITVEMNNTSKQFKSKFKVITGDSLLMPNITYCKLDPDNPKAVLLLGQSLLKYKFLIKIYLADLNCPIDYNYFGEEFPHYLRCFLPEYPRSGYFSVHLGDYKFTYNKFFLISDTTLTIEYFTPKVVIPKSKLLIYGMNFDLNKELDTVFIGKVKAPINSVYQSKDSLRVIEVTVPENAYSNRIIVKVLNSKAVSKENLLVERSINHYPEILSFYPNNGKAGTKVKIKGLYFHPEKDKNHIFFGDVEAKIESLDKNNDIYYLNVVVPDGAKTSIIKLKIGFLEIYSKDVFTIPADMKPVINNLTPDFGIIGSEVSINGNNFGAIKESVSVFFGEVKAEIKSIQNNKIVCIVPNISEDVPIKLTTKYGTASSQEIFKLWHRVNVSISITNIMMNVKSYYKDCNVDTTYFNAKLKPGFTSLASNNRIYDTLNHFSMYRKNIIRNDETIQNNETTRYTIVFDTTNKILKSFEGMKEYYYSTVGNSGGSTSSNFKVNLKDIPLQKFENNQWTFDIENKNISNFLNEIYFKEIDYSFREEVFKIFELNYLLPFTADSKIIITLSFDK